MPLKWIKSYASPSIQLRVVREILPEGSATPDDLKILREDVRLSERVRGLLRAQSEDGLWSNNMLGLAPSKADGVDDVGTIPRYRELIELGLNSDDRPVRLTNRILFRVLSRDDDKRLLFEYEEPSDRYPEMAPWARDLLRQSAVACLAQAGMNEDPRVRGAAHKIATDISNFLRSDIAEDPFVKDGGKWILHPEANPPTLFAVSMLGNLPGFQRDRAGFLDRLGSYLSEPPTKKEWSLKFGRKSLSPTYYVLGDPLQADASGNPKDLALALHWIECLARLGRVDSSPTAVRILTRLYKECDDEGVWNPKSLRSLPRSASRVADFAFPLEGDISRIDQRRSDVTFRLALIAKLMERELDFIV